MSCCKVVLAGFSGAGKTAVGHVLERDYGWRWLDLDREVETRAQASITSIIRVEGEQHFRELERDELLRVLDADVDVVSIGGGTLLREDNREDVLEASLLVELGVSARTAAERVAADESGVSSSVKGSNGKSSNEARRPLLAGKGSSGAGNLLAGNLLAGDLSDGNIKVGDLQIRVLELMLKRLGLYDCAPLKIWTDLAQAEDVARLIDCCWEKAGERKSAEKAVLIPCRKSETEFDCHRLSWRRDAFQVDKGGLDKRGRCVGRKVIDREAIDKGLEQSELLRFLCGGHWTGSSSSGGGQKRDCQFGADLTILSTLPKDELEMLMVEVVRLALVEEEFSVAWLERNAAALGSGRGEVFAAAVERAVHARVWLERLGREHCLGFGRDVLEELASCSIGFGLEASNIEALGIVVSLLRGEELGVTRPGLGKRAALLLEEVGCLVRMPEGILQALNRESGLRPSILLETIGRLIGRATLDEGT